MRDHNLFDVTSCDRGEPHPGVISPACLPYRHARQSGRQGLRLRGSATYRWCGVLQAGAPRNVPGSAGGGEAEIADSTARRFVEQTSRGTGRWLPVSSGSVIAGLVTVLITRRDQEGPRVEGAALKGARGTAHLSIASMVTNPMTLAS
jgi:hypothetical protein